MLKDERDKAKELAALADDYLAGGGAPTICPPAEAAGDRLTPAPGMLADRFDRPDRFDQRGAEWQRRNAVPQTRGSSVLMLGAIFAVGVALIAWSGRRRRR